VTQVDGEMAWSSPTFVRNLGPMPKLAVESIEVHGEPKVGETTRVTAVIRNEGRAPFEPGLVRFMVDGPPATPVSRENAPAKSGIGGLMQTPGLQVWRWPVDETSVNVFVRWGGDEDSRDCAGEIRLLDAQRYIMTPFHVEDEDTIEDDGNGIIRWKTVAEPGTGDGLNMWVRIDPRENTRLSIDATRGGERRPDEIFSRIGKVERIPFELPVVDYDPARWIGETAIPAIGAGGECRAEVQWTPEEVIGGEVVCQVRSVFVKRWQSVGPAR
jgi:hypothetical protein